MKLSVVDPIGPAFERMKLVLFSPFDLGKWLGLGFCAFLMSLGEGGGGPNFHSGADFDPLVEWCRDNMEIVIGIVVAIVIVGLALGILFTWLSSRGHFMFLDGVVRNRGAVAEPWREYRREANSLFLFRICLGLIGFALALLILVGCGLIALPAIQAGEPDASVLIAILVAVLLMIPFAIVMGVITVFLQDFVIPIMYLRRIRTMEAWRVFRESMLGGRAGVFTLYILFKILIGFAIASLAMTAVCLTCCMVAIPYVGTVILLPLFVFAEAYPLYFIEQFGPEWQVFPQKPL